MFMGALIVGSLLIGGLFFKVMLSLYNTWNGQEEYSHGFFIPLICAYFIYQRRQQLAAIAFTGSWFGLMILLAGGLLLIGGRLAVVSTMGQYALVISIWGFALAMLGWRGFKIIWPALLMLIFMVKLPTFLYNNMSC